MANSEIRAVTAFPLVSAMFGANRLVRSGVGTGNRTPDLLITRYDKPDAMLTSGNAGRR